jgi:protein TonB
MAKEDAMTSLTFDDFPSPSRRTRRPARAAQFPLPSFPPARAAAAPRQERRQWAALALVGAIAGLHAGAIVTLAGAKKVVSTPLQPVAVSIALAPQRIEPPPPPPPPPPRTKLPPPRVKAVAPVPATMPPQRMATSAPADNLPQATASPEHAAVAAAEPAPTAAPAPAADEKVSEPRGYAGYLRNPAPDYPPVAQRRGLEGQVVLKVHVLASGQPDSVTVARSSGHAILDEAAIKAVVSWAFAPARRGHTPIDGWVQVPLTFKI